MTAVQRVSNPNDVGRVETTAVGPAPTCPHWLVRGALCPKRVVVQATTEPTQRLWIPMHLPGMNEIVAAAKGRGGRGFAYAKMKRESEGAIVAFCNVAKLRPVKRARLGFLWIEKDRRRDKDNIAAAKKFVIDSLVTAGVLPADGWSAVVGFRDDFDVDKRRHGVEVTITEVS